MKRQLWFRFMTLALIGFGVSTAWHRVDAATFGQQEVSQQNVIAIASPVNGGEAYQLLVVEQVSDSRACWQENQDAAGTVEPLLLNFDFTGICGRATDSNGYSIRVGGEELGLRYMLRVVQSDNVMRLVGTPINDRSAPTLEIGRTKGVTTEFAKIQLNPGWRFTKRTYNGQTLGHYYFTNDQSLAALAAASENTATDPITPSTGTGSTASPSTLPGTLPGSDAATGTPTTEPSGNSADDSATSDSATSDSEADGTTSTDSTASDANVRVIEITRPSAGSAPPAGTETNSGTGNSPDANPLTTPTEPAGSTVVPTLPAPPSPPNLESNAVNSVRVSSRGSSARAASQAVSSTAKTSSTTFRHDLPYLGGQRRPGTSVATVQQLPAPPQTSTIQISR